MGPKPTRRFAWFGGQVPPYSSDHHELDGQKAAYKYQPVCMSKPPLTVRTPTETREQLLAAATALMLRQGYARTSVDQICAEAGLTKGSFFHHFANKDALCSAAIDAWGAMGERLYATAWSDPEADPLDQLHRFFDIMISFTTDPDQPCVCMVGMMAQELSLTHPSLGARCADHLARWTAPVARLLTAAKRRHAPAVPFAPERIAWLLNTIWQGSMLIAKTRQTPELIASNLNLARAYVDGLFAPSVRPEPTPRKRG